MSGGGVRREGKEVMGEWDGGLWEVGWHSYTQATKSTTLKTRDQSTITKL